MGTGTRRTALRILAPLALIAAAIALYMIVSSFDNSSGGSNSQSKAAAAKARDLGTSATSKKPRRHSTRGKLPQSVYIVKTGDTLGSIAQITGVPVEKLQTLNPNLDQFSLVAGQKIKIR